MFQTGFLSVIRSPVLYTQQQIWDQDETQLNQFHPDPASKQSV